MNEHDVPPTYGALLRRNAELYGERRAIVHEDRTITWAELDGLVDHWSKALLAEGIGHGDVVSIHAPNLPEWMLLAMGCARIGAMLAPLNTFHRDDEITYQLAHSEAKLIFLVEQIRRNNYTEQWDRLIPEVREGGEVVSEVFPDLRKVVQLQGTPRQGSVPLDEWLARAAEISDEELAAAADAVQPSDTAYLMYTSGSTAYPKAVQIEHHGGLVNTFNIGERQGLDHTDLTWIASPLFYGLATINAIPGVWTHGGGILLQETFNAGESLELIERARPTAYVSLGNMIKALYHHPDREKRDISSLQKGIAGFSSEDLGLVIHGLGVEQCISIYGLTETYGNCFVSDWQDPAEVRINTSGTLLPGWEYKIVDPEDESRELPAGEIGHILARGYTTSGYFKNPEATADAFTEDGYFRTGDLVSIDADGRLRFNSRIKEMMKVKGVNVSPQEVEVVIEKHPSVVESHVVGVPDDVAGELVVAFVGTEDKELTDSDIVDFVTARAIRYKVPSHVFLMTPDELPRVGSGKVPKRFLRELAVERLTANAG